jgi:putative protease
MTEREIEVAHVEDYFSHLGVAALKITSGQLQVGDVLHFKGHTTDLLQEVASMQSDHHQIKRARTGEIVGIKVLERVREHDRVYKVFLEESR